MRARSFCRIVGAWGLGLAALAASAQGRPPTTEQLGKDPGALRQEAERQRADRQLLRYREAIVPQTSAAVDAARASYLAGRGDFSTVIEDFELWLAARAEVARREADRFEIWAQLEALVAPAPATEGESE